MKKGKRSPKPSNEASGSMNPLVKTNIEITQADLATVAVSRAEAQLQGDLEATLDNIKVAEAELRSLEKEVKEAINNHAKSMFEGKVNALEAAFKALAPGANVRLKPIVDFAIDRISSFQVEVEFSISELRGWFMASRHVVHCHDVPGLPELQSRLNRFIAELKELQQKAIALRRKIANIPALERRFRAMLIESQLASTQDGRELLASIGLDPERAAGTIVDAIRALPSA